MSDFLVLTKEFCRFFVLVSLEIYRNGRVLFPSPFFGYPQLWAEAALKLIIIVFDN
jgi:hypothetical protein